MLEFSVYQRRVACRHARTQVSIPFQSWDRFWRLSDDQPSLPECPFGIEGDEPIPRDVVHNESRMEFCDGVNYVSLESRHDIDFTFGVRVYEIEHEHHVSFLGKSTFGIDNIAGALRECEKGA